MAAEHQISEFVCLRCGNCCVGEGFVWLTVRDIARIAAHLEMTRAEFRRRFTRRAEGKVTLTDQPGPERACVFYDVQAGCCRINEVKSQQCVDFPTRWRDPDAITLCRGLQAPPGDA